HAAVIEAAVGKNRDRGDRRAAALETEILRDLKLADIELPVAHEAAMALARGQRQHFEMERRGDLAFDQRTGAVVVAAGEGEQRVGHRARGRGVENLFGSWENRGSVPASKPRCGRCQAAVAFDKRAAAY